MQDLAWKEAEHLVFLDREHAHCGDGTRSPFLPKGPVFGEAEFDVSVL